MERRTGSARLTATPEGQGEEDDLLRAVKEAAAAEYEIFGEMGRGERGSVVYLSRERSSRRLVALKLRPDGSEYELSVLRELDASVPAAGNKCPACSFDLVGWGRFCSHCGMELSGKRAIEQSREEMLTAVHEAARGAYEVLGEMQRSEGGGIVYFARELGSGRLVSLRLVREQRSDGTETSALDVTPLIKPLVTSLGATYDSPKPVMQPASMPPSRSAAPSPRSPQPIARSVTPPSVIVPDDLLAAVEPQPPRKPVPVVPIAVAAAVLIASSALFVFARSRREAPGAEQDPPTSVVIPAAPAPLPAPVAAIKIDSGAIAIGSLPPGARVTVNGSPVSERQLWRLPGRYQLVATAPGYRSLSQPIDVVAGQMVSWTPTMQSMKAAAPAHGARKPAPVARPNAVSSAPNCFNAYSDQNWAAALLACTREANAGNQPAQRNLATIYDQGLGTNKDPAQAAIWFRKAA